MNETVDTGPKGAALQNLFEGAVGAVDVAEGISFHADYYGRSGKGAVVELGSFF
jgi:hypothetical protein